MSYEPLDRRDCPDCTLPKYCKEETKLYRCKHCGEPLGRCEIINDPYNKWGNILCRVCYVNSGGVLWQKPGHTPEPVKSMYVEPKAKPKRQISTNEDWT